MTSFDKALLGKLTDGDVVALTLWGEARSEGIEGRVAVANVIGNRVLTQRAIFGWTYRDVCLKPAQFSCWAAVGGAKNYDLVIDTAHNLLQRDRAIGPILRECQWIADGLMREQFVDSTRGATHYLTADLYASAHVPSWAKDQPILTRVRSHVYMRIA